ncbi:class I SAM-dependent methyltransferase [Maridesulfovibrio bastinii]|uniref:class I SAM-dependent methyltransferase n=1 Tax=Maridesulfovibrio bastinii TaxID=47157 RepID=UPI00041CF1FA|nr:methyltransferase domain-containing protein [Maridesulfovibrio bastinii]
MENVIKHNPELWLKNLPEEANYWYGVISGFPNKQKQAESFRKKASGELPFPTVLRPFLIKNSETSILDVGAGPHTVIGLAGLKEKIKIVAIDPLADVYNEILSAFNIVPAIMTQQGIAEELDLDNLGQFDLVYSRNAIDHSYNPIKAIENMLLATKKTGTLFIEGAVNEGKRQNYHGLHQWNFLPDEENGDMLLWNKEVKISLRKHFQNKCSIKARRNGKTFYLIIKHC